jgi:HlyD family secretion protein
MLKRLRYGIYLGCLLIFAAAYLRVRWQDERAPVQAVLDSTLTDRGDILLTVSATGPLQATQQVPLVFLATGKVSLVNVRAGDRVLKGQTLARLDMTAQQTALNGAQIALNFQQAAFDALTHDPRSVDVQAAQSALDASNAQLAAAGVGYDPLQVKLAQYELELTKNLLWQSQLQRDMAVQAANAPNPAWYDSLYAQINALPSSQRATALQALDQLSGLVSGRALALDPKDANAAVRRSEYDVQIAQAQLGVAQDAHPDATRIATAQVAVLSAQTTLDQLLKGADSDTIAIARMQLKAAHAAVDLAGLTLAQGTLFAPFEGVVAQVNLTIGQAPSSTQPAVILVDDSGFYVDVPIDETDIAKVQVGQTATFTFDALPDDTLSGRVNRIAPVALNTTGIVTYPVRLGIDSHNATLRVGMTTTATITVNRIEKVIRLRNRFIRIDRKTGQTTCYVREPDGSIQQVTLTIGLRNETYTEIKSGLRIGQEVVILPHDLNLF